MKRNIRVHRWLAVVASVLGALAIVAGEPYPAGARREGVSEIGVLDLARSLRDSSAGIRLIDVRADSHFAAYHIPRAERVAVEQLRRREWRRGETVVIYADDTGGAEEASIIVRNLGVEGARVLRGGLLAWIDSIAEPRLAALPATATRDEQTARREHLELSRYFGGMPVVSPPPSGARPDAKPPRASRRSEAAAVARVLRRGC
jgi:rhodanese-related sulfurtransferase